MKKTFFIKFSILLLVAVLFFGARIYLDPFNVFHWKDIRFIAVAPNKNFIKTKLILSQPNKYNAFLFGSSRIGTMPPVSLPKTFNGKTLNWYNMTYATGIPKEQLETIKTFVKNGVKIDLAVVQFDELSMYVSAEKHKKENITMPYQIYERNKLLFFLPYIKTKCEMPLIKSIMNYDKSEHIKDKKDFYEFGSYGAEMEIDDISNLNEPEDPEKFKPDDTWSYTEINSHKDIEELVDFCDKNSINLILLTTPLYHATYRVAVNKGYFDFLKKVAQKCEFYNFSSINNCTKDHRYYLECIHYRPALGVILEKLLFGTEEEKAKIRKEAGDDSWGEKINASNVDLAIQKLQDQLLQP